MEGGELMTMLQIAMMGNLPYTRLRDAIFAHPTLAESLNNLFSLSLRCLLFDCQFLFNILGLRFCNDAVWMNLHSGGYHDFLLHVNRVSLPRFCVFHQQHPICGLITSKIDRWIDLLLVGSFFLVDETHRFL